MTAITDTPRSRRLLRLAVLTVPALAAIVAVACNSSTAAELPNAVSYGAEVRVGNGVARTYVLTNGSAPTEVGVALSEAAMTGLPVDHAPGGMQMPDGHHTYDQVLQLPSNNPTPYTFVLFGWNPAGHEPPGIYDQPHFDFHFYTVSDAERSAILPTDPEFATKAGRAPAAELTPAGYTQIPGAVPMMGAHWVDPNSPELHGTLFTKTMLYGTWDGKLIFAEPMITKAFIESKPDFRTPIAVPTKYATAGFYPKEYRVYWEPERKEYRIALANFALQK